MKNIGTDDNGEPVTLSGLINPSPCVQRELLGYAIGTVFFYAGQTEMLGNEKKLFCGTWMVTDKDKSPSDVFQDIIDAKHKEFKLPVGLTALNIITA